MRNTAAKPLVKETCKHLLQFLLIYVYVYVTQNMMSTYVDARSYEATTINIKT